MTVADACWPARVPERLPPRTRCVGQPSRPCWSPRVPTPR